MNIVTKDGKKYLYDKSLEQMESKLNNDLFYRVNRKLMINIEAIEKIHRYSNSRLKLELKPTFVGDVIVSRDRVGDFKNWLDR